MSYHSTQQLILTFHLEFICHFLLYCRVHYKEYLVNKINKEGLDPVEMYSVHQVKLILKREELEVPEEEDKEEEEHYKGRLVEVGYY